MSKRDLTGRQMPMFAEAVADAAVASEAPPIYWPDEEKERTEEQSARVPDPVPMDPAYLWQRWCRGAFLSDAQLTALKHSDFAKPLKEKKHDRTYGREEDFA